MDELRRPKHGPNTDMYFTTMEAEGEGWDPVKLFWFPSSNSLLTVPMRYFDCGTFVLFVMYCLLSIMFSFNNEVSWLYI